MLKENVKDLMRLSAKVLNDKFPEDQKKYIALVVLDMYKSGELIELLNILEKSNL